ncbi:MAG: IS256 family transposase [candidate division WOR-3 bacterium]
MKNNVNIDEKIKGLIKEIEDSPDLSLRMLFGKILNQFMKAERKAYLEGSFNNRGNGYYKRGIQAGGMSLDVQIPRDREGEFRPQILPDKWKRGGNEYRQLLLSLVKNGYSENKIRGVLKELNLSYDKSEVKKIKEKFLLEVKEFKQRELGKEWFTIFIDADEVEVKEDGKVRKAQVYTVIGIDLKGNKDLLTWRIYFGSEKKSWWIELFRDLASRGLEGVSVIISDDFPGMREAVKEIFPESNHQLFYVHLQRNTKHNMEREDSQEFNKVLRRIKELPDYDSGCKMFEELCNEFKDKYPNYMEYLLERKENYLQFLKYPEGIRKFIYTSNIAESFNSLIEGVRYERGWYFQSTEILDISVLLIYKRLSSVPWRKPHPHLRSEQYRLNRIYHLQYSREEL